LAGLGEHHRPQNPSYPHRAHPGVLPEDVRPVVRLGQGQYIMQRPGLQARTNSRVPRRAVASRRAP
jgi:hypothetical protein